MSIYDDMTLEQLEEKKAALLQRFEDMKREMKLEIQAVTFSIEKKMARQKLQQMSPAELATILSLAKEILPQGISSEEKFGEVG